MTISNILQEIRDLCDGTSTTAYLDNTTLLRRVNQAYEEIVGFIIGIDGLWQFDDTNFTDFPIGITTLVNSQPDYTFDNTFLEIEGVSVLDNSNIWHQLTPLDKSRFGQDPIEFFKTDGLPMYYDKQGRSAVLYPAPDNGVSVTLTSGLKVFFKRTASIYTSAEFTTGTKEPGFASPYHVILAYKASLPFCMAYRKERVPFLLSEIKRLQDDITVHYGRRELDRKKVMSMRGIWHR